MINEANKQAYGNKVRTRVCGLLIRNNKILLLNHSGLNTENTFWSPPGGGIEFGESLEDCLKREFLEEVNLTVSVKECLLINEHIEDSLHAIELFYLVESDGVPQLGQDPEVHNSFTEMKWLSQKELDLIPNQTKHSIIQRNPSLIQYIIEKS